MIHVVEQDNLYNQMFGYNPYADEILRLMGLDRRKMGRFRDAFVCQGEVVVYTRLGNTVAMGKFTPQEMEAFRKYLRSHPRYLREATDTRDSTYCTFYFAVPHSKSVKLLTYDTPVPWEPDKRWKEGLEEMHRMSPEELKLRFPSTVHALEEILKDIKP